MTTSELHDNQKATRRDSLRASAVSMKVSAELVKLAWKDRGRA